jgi:hypothetical protein
MSLMDSNISISIVMISTTLYVLHFITFRQPKIKIPFKKKKQVESISFQGLNKSDTPRETSELVNYNGIPCITCILLTT